MAHAAVRSSRCGRIRKSASRCDTQSGPIARARARDRDRRPVDPQDRRHRFRLPLAKQFGLKLIDTRPALVPLTFAAADWEPFAALSGVSLEVELATGNKKTGAEFREDLLLTHRGLSGPGVLQISSYWQPGEPISHQPVAGAWTPRQPCSRRKPARKQSDRQSACREWVPRGSPHVWLRSPTDFRRSPRGRFAGQDPAPRRRSPVALDAHAQRHGRLSQGRSDARRRRHARPVVIDDDERARRRACTSSAKRST